MIDDIFNVLYTGKTGIIVPEAKIEDNLYGKKFYDAHSGVITTATGNPVSIVTNKAQNAISTILSYSPKQSGSGDPSPDNVRPIIGWTEANLGVNSETPTTTISLGGTYYGFSIDVERGVLRVTHAEANLSDLSWSLRSGGAYRTTVDDLKVDGSLSEKALCSNLLIKLNAYGTSYPDDVNILWQYVNTNYLYIRVNDLSDLTGGKLVYELATPLELPLTPQTVALLSGNNTLWTDGDSLSVTYKAKR